MIKWNLVWSFIGTIFIPILYLVNIQIALTTKGTFYAPMPILLTGVLIATFGIIFWIISFINLRHNFGVLPQKQKRIKTGLYKYFSHPMYIGIWACFFGLSLANASWPGLVFLNLVTTPLLFIRAYFEERKLT